MPFITLVGCHAIMLEFLSFPCPDLQRTAYVFIHDFSALTRQLAILDYFHSFSIFVWLRIAYRNSGLPVSTFSSHKHRITFHHIA